VSGVLDCVVWRLVAWRVAFGGLACGEVACGDVACAVTWCGIVERVWRRWRETCRLRGSSVVVGAASSWEQHRRGRSVLLPVLDFVPVSLNCVFYIVYFS